MEGWIKNTGKCLVEKGTRVDVQYRCGIVNSHVRALVDGDRTGSDERFNASDWKIDGHHMDIVAWRLSN